MLSWYRFHSSDALDLQTLQAGINQIASDSGNCIKFVRYNKAADAGKDYLYIANRLPSGKSLAQCFTYPGRSDEQKGRGQYMVMFSSRVASNGNISLSIMLCFKYRSTFRYLQ